MNSKHEPGCEVYLWETDVVDWANPVCSCSAVKEDAVPVETFKECQIDKEDRVVRMWVKWEAMRADPEILGAVATLYGVPAADLLKYINALEGR